MYTRYCLSRSILGGTSGSIRLLQFFEIEVVCRLDCRRIRTFLGMGDQRADEVIHGFVDFIEEWPDLFLTRRSRLRSLPLCPKSVLICGLTSLPTHCRLSGTPRTSAEPERDRRPFLNRQHRPSAENVSLARECRTFQRVQNKNVRLPIIRTRRTLQRKWDHSCSFRFEDEDIEGMLHFRLERWKNTLGLCRARVTSVSYPNGTSVSRV